MYFASKVSIISQAYGLLGRPAINTLLNSDPIDVSVSQRYDVLVPSLLTATQWKHAGKTIKLTKLTDTPPIDRWQYTYQLPNKAELLFVYRLDPPIFDYEIIRDKLYANHDDITMFYMANTNETEFPIYFTNYVVYALASDIAMLVTQQIELAKLYAEKAKESKVIATVIDGQQTPSKAIVFDSLEMAHRGGSVGVGGFV